MVEHDLCIETLGVLLKTLHQIRALHAMDIRGPVIDLGGGHQLAPLGHTRDQKWF